MQQIERDNIDLPYYCDPSVCNVCLNCKRRKPCGTPCAEYDNALRAATPDWYYGRDPVGWAADKKKRRKDHGQ